MSKFYDPSHHLQKDVRRNGNQSPDPPSLPSQDKSEITSNLSSNNPSVSLTIDRFDPSVDPMAKRKGGYNKTPLKRFGARTMRPFVFRCGWPRCDPLGTSCMTAMWSRSWIGFTAGEQLTVGIARVRVQWAAIPSPPSSCLLRPPLPSHPIPRQARFAMPD